MINSLAEELSQSYIGYYSDNPKVTRFIVSMVTSCGGQEQLIDVGNLLNLPWPGDTVDLIKIAIST